MSNMQIAASVIGYVSVSFAFTYFLANRFFKKA